MPDAKQLNHKSKVRFLNKLNELLKKTSVVQQY